VFDSFLKFLLKDFLEECSPFVKEKAVHVMQCLTVGGVFGDLVAFRKEGFKFGEEKRLNLGRGKAGMHKYFRVKGS
jgi:hypothetical protein